MVGVGHHLLAGSLRRPGCIHVEVEDGVEAVLVQQVYVRLDRRLVGGAAVGGTDAVDVQPAVFIQRDPDGVDVPGGHGRDRGRIVGPVENTPALDAGVFGAGAIDAQQPDGRTVAVHEAIAGDGN